SGADATRTNRESTRMGMEEGLIRAATIVVLTTVNWQPGGHREIPLRESQRDSAPKPGVAPPRRYPGYMPHISTTLKGLCRGTIGRGWWRMPGTARMDNGTMGFQCRNQPCAW
ncbi:MAG: hypothetical protein NTX27_00465, partial [Verrucomicrobia bacterium]|nr:hypothetical protein [Verrucomicrobiota bacterium]